MNVYPLVQSECDLVRCSAASVARPVDVSFGVRVPIQNDGDCFSISRRAISTPVYVVDTWGRRFSNPDDLAVFLHICKYSRVGPDAVYAYRRQGMSWFDVGLRVGVPVETGTCRWPPARPALRQGLRLLGQASPQPELPRPLDGPANSRPHRRAHGA
jgi:hypothetical protein